jgi:hypothetical protein
MTSVGIVTSNLLTGLKQKSIANCLLPGLESLQLKVTNHLQMLNALVGNKQILCGTTPEEP